MLRMHPLNARAAAGTAHCAAPTARLSSAPARRRTPRRTPAAADGSAAAAAAAAPPGGGLVVGIDLGTTNSAVAHIRKGAPVCIPNAEGDTLTPSVVGERALPAAARLPTPFMQQRQQP